MNARGDQTRAKLIQATIDVVAEVGYARATTRAIAEAAGVAEGTIYRHYTDKRQLFFAAVFDRNAAVLEWVTALPARAGKATVRGNLREALIRLGELRTDLLPLELALRGDPELAGPLGTPDSGGPGAGHSGGVGLALPGPPAFVAAYLAAEQNLGRVKADVDTTRAAIIVLAMLFGIAMLPSTDDSLNTALIDTAVDIIVAGIGPTPA